MLIQIQIVADIVLLIALLLFFRYINSLIKKRERFLSEQNMDEFKKLLEDSRNVTEEFIRAIEAGRRSLKEVISSIDEKERHLNSLAGKTESLSQLGKTNNGLLAGYKGKPRSTKQVDKNGGDLLNGEGRQKVLEMAAEGLSSQKIAELLGVTEGEIRLILNLHSLSRKNIE